MADVIMNEMTQEEFEKMSKEVSDEMLEGFDEVTEISDDELDAVSGGNIAANTTLKNDVFNKWMDAFRSGVTVYVKTKSGVYAAYVDRVRYIKTATTFYFTFFDVTYCKNGVKVTNIPARFVTLPTK